MGMKKSTNLSLRSERLRTTRWCEGTFYAPHVTVYFGTYYGKCETKSEKNRKRWNDMEHVRNIMWACHMVKEMLVYGMWSGWKLQHTPSVQMA